MSTRVILDKYSMHVHHASIYQRVTLIVYTRYLLDAYPPCEYLSSIEYYVSITSPVGINIKYTRYILDIEYLSSIYRVVIEFGETSIIYVCQWLIVSSIYVVFSWPRATFYTRANVIAISYPLSSISSSGPQGKPIEPIISRNES